MLGSVSGKELQPLVLGLVPPDLRGSLSQLHPPAATTVLVVDDQRLPRRLASRLLTEEGYRVLEAEGAPEALDVLSQMRGGVDLLVLEQPMDSDCPAALFRPGLTD
jgi:response regulator RpfG family c-di-GMP phosphodiesterase